MSIQINNLRITLVFFVKASVFISPLVLGGLYYHHQQKEKAVLEAENVQWEIEIAAKKLENQEIKQRMEELRHDRENIMKQLNDKSSALTAIQSHMWSLQDSVRSISKKLNASHDQYGNLIEKDKYEYDLLMAEKNALEDQISEYKSEAEQYKVEFSNYVSLNRDQLGISVALQDNGDLLTVEQAQSIISAQQQAFTQDLEMLFEAFENEMNALINHRKRKVSKFEVRASLERIRAIYEQLRNKYQTPIFDSKINSLKRQISFT